ncbi:uncharacterized protein LOC111863203 isoform X2 [Cryptotermes secundus]|nr:uncharacterized protein LOC111863203 isoform X2 [Cryptotermes secundus]
MSLQENLISIINYNLDSEYDVKILDPNFVKLFKLAQLSVDYLMYSEQHLYNCIELEQQHSRKHMKEVEKVKRECKKKDDEIKNLKKKFKEMSITEIQKRQQHFKTGNGKGISNCFKCTHCGKTFLTSGYLEAHHVRRHPHITFMHLPDTLRSETERLQSEIKGLKERLNNTERLLHKESIQDIKEKEEAQDRGDDWTEEKRRMVQWQQTQQNKYLNEIADLKTVFYNEIKRLKEPSQHLREPTATSSNAGLLERTQKQDEGLALLRERLSGQSTPDMENMQSRLEAQERFWKSRLKQIETEHKREMDRLGIQLNQAKESHNSHYAMYESNIQELMAHIARQDETLRAQEIKILHLTQQHSAKTQQPENAQVVLEMQPQSSENATTVDPSITFTELTARIDRAIHANKRPPDGVNTRQSTQSPVKGETKSHTSLSRRPLSVKNVASPVDSRGGPESVKQSVRVTNITTNSKHSTESLMVDPQDESSSDSSPQTLKTKTGMTSMYELTDQEVNTSDKGRSPQGSKDSGLDSPKRFSTTPIKKINAFQGLSSIKTTPAIGSSKDRVDHVNEDTGSEDEAGGEKEEETISDETETETDSCPASVLSLKNALQQNPQILTGLKEDLRDLCARRLRELGVNPEWKGIPAATFCQKMATLKHHQTITAKRHKAFFKIKQKMIDELNRRLPDKKTNSQPDKSKSGGKEEPSGSSQQHKAAAKKLVGRVKTRALNVLKHSRGRLSAHSARGLQETNSKDKAVVSVHQKENAVTTEKLVQNTSIMNKSLRLKRWTEERKSVGSRTSAAVSKVNIRSAEQTTTPNVTMVTSTPFKNTSTATTVTSSRRSILKGNKNIAASEMVGGKKTVESLSISSMEEADITERGEDSYDVSDGDEVQQGITNTFSQPLHHSQDLHPHTEMKPNTSSGVSQTIIKDLSSDLESPGGNRSVLKTPSSSLGSITKKRVLFVDQENELASQKNQETEDSMTKSSSWNASKIVATSELHQSAETTAVKLLSSWDSSPLTGLKRSVTSSNQSSTRNSDSDSDWGHSSALNTMEHAGSARSYGQINVSTKQSDKIAQISKNIEKQLSLSRLKPPVGSVEAMFRATGSEKISVYQGTDLGSTRIGSSVSDSNCENMNLNNTTSAPVPKPRSNQPTLATQQNSSKLCLSDWDLEDFDE